MYGPRIVLVALGTLGLLVWCGCGHQGPQLAAVEGSVKFADGSVPAGEVRTIRFEPTAGADGKSPDRPATATIQPDGSFKLMTFKPGDGALQGTYKVVLVVFRTYMKREPVLADAYAKAATTPLETVTVKAGQKNQFDFVVEPRPAGKQRG